MTKSIFLSHNFKDRPFAQRLAADLRARAIKVWIDEAEIRVGDSLIGKIEAAIDDVDYLAVILSEHSVESEWVLKEVRMAMHREIAGKRVVVLPLLYRDCKLPGFLREKLYVDFRHEINYERGVVEIVRRVREDQVTDANLSDGFQALEEIPLTRVWRTAIKTDRLSGRFVIYLKNVLIEISAKKEAWRPDVAASYIFFVSELVQSGLLKKDAWNVLCSIVENQKINLWLRHTTLERMLPAGRTMIEDGLVNLPKLYSDREGTIESHLVSFSIQNFLTAHTPRLEIAASLRVISLLWEIGDTTLRKLLLKAFGLYMQNRGGTASNLVESLRERLEGPQSDIEPVLINIREWWLTSDNLDSISIASNRAHIVLRRLLNEKATLIDQQQLIKMFREASKLEEKGDFSVYEQAMDVLSSDKVKLLRHLQGDAFTYSFLTAISVDPYIEVTISAIAFTALITEYDSEALLLDDRLPRSLFKAKRRGQFRISVVDALFGSEMQEPSDYMNMHLLLTLHSVLEQPELKVFMKKLKKVSKESKRIAVFEAFCLGEISYEDLKIKLEELVSPIS
jgi:hypothetical protein